MDQNLWGPSMWFILHTVGFGYPFNPTNKEKKEYYDFFKSLGSVLPCSVCRKHFKRNMTEHPINLNSRIELNKWLILVHNEINSRCGKPQMTLNDVIELYERKFGKKIFLTQDDEKNDKTSHFNWNGNLFYINENDKFWIPFILIITILFIYYIRSIKLI